MLRFQEPRRRGMNHSEQQQLPPGWQFIDLAALGSNTAHSYAAALARTILYPLAVAAVLGAIAGVGHVSGSSAAAVGVLLQYGPIVVAGGAVLYSVERRHRRTWLSLIAPGLRIDWRRLAIGCGAELAIVLGQLALIHAVTGWPWKFALPAALPLVACTLLLIPLQAASEELLFRGYLTQALGRIVRSRVLIAVIVGLVFGLLHLNAYGPLTLPYFFVLSLVFSLVSLRDDRLELAIGGHSAMNFFAVATASFSPLTPGVVGLGDGAVPFNGAAIVVLMVNGALFYGITRLLVRLFCERRAPP
jgi:membrane protease YdiL (CAAX protease family)